MQYWLRVELKLTIKSIIKILLNDNLEQIPHEKYDGVGREEIQLWI